MTSDWGVKGGTECSRPGYSLGPARSSRFRLHIIVSHSLSVRHYCTEWPFKKNNYRGLRCKSKQYHSSVVATESSTSCVHSQDNDSSFGWDRKCRSGGIGITTPFPFIYKNTQGSFQPSFSVSLKVYTGCWTCDTVYFGSWTCGSEPRRKMIMGDKEWQSQFYTVEKEKKTL